MPDITVSCEDCGESLGDYTPIADEVQVERCSCRDDMFREEGYENGYEDAESSCYESYSEGYREGKEDGMRVASGLFNLTEER